jgi:Gamma-glutamyl cyclotransferase, AIG2-like
MAHSMIIEVLETCKGAGLPVRTAILEPQHFILYNFRRRKVRGRDNAGILLDPASRVRGLRIKGLTDNDVQAFDLYAGALYERQKVMVKCMENRSLEEDIPNSALASIPGAVEEVETYVCLHPTILENEDWDFWSWLRAGSTRNASFPPSNFTATEGHEWVPLRLQGVVEDQQ